MTWDSIPPSVASSVLFMRSAAESLAVHLPSGATQMCDFSGFSVEKVLAEESRVFCWPVRISTISGNLGPLPSRCYGCCRGFLFPAFSRVRRRRPLYAQPVSFVVYKSPHRVLTANLDTAVCHPRTQGSSFQSGLDRPRPSTSSNRRISHSFLV